MTAESTNSLKLNDILDFSFAKKLSSEDRDTLHAALQSLAKRNQYCNYHYLTFQNNSSRKDLLMDRYLGFRDENGFDFRTIYEANAVAFLQNLHAMVDSAPYLINILHRQCPIEDQGVSWRENFINKYSTFSFYKEVLALSSMHTWKVLKGLVNRMKHKHLVPIKNDTENLRLSPFVYENKRASTNEKIQDEQYLRTFMAQCHDELIPQYFELLRQVAR